MLRIEDLLLDPAITHALGKAWRESNPGLSGGHEEGGFIVLDATNQWQVIRWPTGAGSRIEVPEHPDCRTNGFQIIATFHTHPNTGGDYLQEPSETDKRAVRSDPDLLAPPYLGELVISEAITYFITRVGQVLELGSTQRILKLP